MLNIEQILSGVTDFELLEKMDLSKAKLMFVNFPHMPTGQLPSAGMFDRLVAFAKKHNILLLNQI